MEPTTIAISIAVGAVVLAILIGIAQKLKPKQTAGYDNGRLIN